MTTIKARVRFFNIVTTVILALLTCLFLFGCSSSSGSNSGSGAKPQETVNGYSIAEYNSDVSELEQILSEAIHWDDSMKSMGNTDAFTTQEQVDEYNYYVDQYNDAASRYNVAAKKFSQKYGMTIDGVSGVPVDPRDIDVPERK